jgi:hypothetical protein
MIKFRRRRYRSGIAGSATLDADGIDSVHICQGKARKVFLNFHGFSVAAVSGVSGERAQQDWIMCD